MKICFLGGARYGQPLDETTEKKFRALAALGDIYVIGFATDWLPKCFSQHAHFYLLPKLPFPPLRYLTMFTLGPALALWLCLRKGVRVLVAQSPYEGFAAAVTKKAAGWLGTKVALIVESHGDFEESLFLYRRVQAPSLYRALMERTAAWALCHADLLRAISHATRSQLEANAPEGKPVFQFPAWTDIDIFLEPPEHGIDPNGNILLYAGVLIPLKGLNFLLRAFERVASSLPSARLLLVGSPENQSYVHELKSMVERLGIEEKVEFIDEVSQRELAGLMQACRAFVLPSLSEGLGRVILEAMACGKPVIGSKVGGIIEVIEEGQTGFLIPPGDVEALAERLTWILTHPEEAGTMGRRAREFARGFFSKDSYVKSYASIFKEARQLLNKGPSK